MDHLVPKGGAGPPTGDGAFERFLSAAIATIITIIFSWRMVDKLNEETRGDAPTSSSSSSSFSSPSQLSSTASSRIPVAKKKDNNNSSSLSSLISRALPFSPFPPHQESPHSPTSSASSSPSSSISSSSSSSRRQLPPIPTHPNLTDHQQRLLNERTSSSHSSKYRKEQNIPERGNSTFGYKFTQLKPIIRVPVDLPLCGDDDDDDGLQYSKTTGYKNSNSDVKMRDSSSSSSSMGTLGESPNYTNSRHQIVSAQKSSPSSFPMNSKNSPKASARQVGEDEIDFRLLQASGMRHDADVVVGDGGGVGEELMDVKEGRRNVGGDRVYVTAVDARQDRFGGLCEKSEISPVSCSTKNNVPYRRSVKNDCGDNYFDAVEKDNNSAGVSGSASLKRGYYANRKKSSEENDDDLDDDEDVREELREIESAFGISEVCESYSSERNSSRGVIEAATAASFGTKESEENNFIDKDRSGSGSEIIYLDRSIEEVGDIDDDFDPSASQYLKNSIGEDGVNPFLNVSWDSVPKSALQGSCVDGENSFFRGHGVVDLREVSERIRVLDGRCVVTTDLDDDEDEFYLASSKSRPLGSFGRTSRGGESFTCYNNDNEDDDDEEDFDEFDDDVIIHDIDDDFDDDQQPRELHSDEELFCCSLLEPIMEEDSEDLSSTSSSDIDPNSHSPRVLRRLVLQQLQASKRRSDLDALDGDSDESDDDVDRGRFTPRPVEAVSPVIITSPSFTPRQSNLSLLEQTTPPLLSPALRSPRSPSPLSPKVSRTASPRRPIINSPISNVSGFIPNSDSETAAQPDRETGDLNTKHISSTSQNNTSTTHNIDDSIQRVGAGSAIIANPPLQKDEHNKDVPTTQIPHVNPNNVSQDVFPDSHSPGSQTVTANNSDRSLKSGSGQQPPTKRSITTASTSDAERERKSRRIMNDDNNIGTDIKAEEAMEDEDGDFDRSLLDQYKINQPTEHSPMATDEYNYLDHIRHYGSSVDGFSQPQQQTPQSPSSSSTGLSRSTGDKIESGNNNTIDEGINSDLNLPPFGRKLDNSVTPVTDVTTAATSPLTETERVATTTYNTTTTTATAATGDAIFPTAAAGNWESKGNGSEGRRNVNDYVATGTGYRSTGGKNRNNCGDRSTTATTSTREHDREIETSLLSSTANTVTRSSKGDNAEVRGNNDCNATSNVVCSFSGSAEPCPSFRQDLQQPVSPITPSGFTTHSHSRLNDKDDSNTTSITEVGPGDCVKAVGVCSSSISNSDYDVGLLDNNDVSDVKDGKKRDNNGVNLNSFVQTFSTRVEGEDDLSQSESDESVQTVITRKLSQESLTRKLSSDSSSGGGGSSNGSAGATCSNTNNNSSNNSPAHSSSSSSSSSSSVLVDVRTNASKATRRPLSDSLVYQNSKKPKSDDIRDRIVSEGGGLPFEGEEDDIEDDIQSQNIAGVSSYLSGDKGGGGGGLGSSNNRNNNFDLRAYQSYSNLSSFGDSDSDGTNSPGNSNQLYSLKDRFENIRSSGLGDHSEEGDFDISHSNNNRLLRRLSDISDNSDYQYYPASDDGDFDNGDTPGAFYTDDYVRRPHTVSVLSSGGYNTGRIDLDSGQDYGGHVNEFEAIGIPTASRLSHIEEEEEEEVEGGDVEAGDDNNIPPSYSEISDYSNVCDSVTTTTTAGGKLEGRRDLHSIVNNTKASVVTGDSGDVDNVDWIDGGDSGKSGRDKPVHSLTSVKTVVVSSKPVSGSERTVVISKSKMDNRREYTFGKTDGGSGYRGGDEYYPGGREGEEEEDEEWEETVTETFIVPESREKVIQRTLQNVKDMLDKRSNSSDQLERRRRADGSYDDVDVDFDEECQSTCTTTLIDVVSHDAMGFHGDDDERSGYRSAQDAVARTDGELKSKMGFQLDLEDFKVKDYNTESGWPIVRYIEKERAFVDEEGEDVMDNEQEEGEDEFGSVEGEEEVGSSERQARYMEQERDEFRRSGLEVDDDEDEVGEEFKPKQGFFYPQTESLQHQSPRKQKVEEKVDIPMEYEDNSSSQNIPKTYYIPRSDRDDKRDSQNMPYAHVENKRPYEQSDDAPSYEERMNLPYKLMKENIPAHHVDSKDIPSYDDYDDEPYRRRDRDRPRKPDVSDNSNNNTPYSDRKRQSQTPDLRYDDEKLERGDNMPQSQTRPFHDPEQVHVVSAKYPQSQTAPQHSTFPPFSPKQSLQSPSAQVPESPTIQLAVSEHFPRQLSGRKPVETSADFGKEKSASLEVGASVKQPPSQKIQEYSSSSDEQSDTRGKPDDGFDSFLRGMPEFAKQDEAGYEEFVRDISDMDDFPPDENYGDSEQTLKPPESVGILSGNLTSPCKKSNVFVFPKDNAKPGSKTHSSPSYVGESADKIGDSGSQQNAAAPQEADNATGVDDFPRFGTTARRSSSYSLYDSTGNVLNASFDESEMSGFALEKYNNEPGSNRSRSSEGLNRSKSREGISDSPRSRNSDLSVSVESPGRDNIKAANTSPKLFHSARNVGVSSEPALDVVIESSAMTPQLSPVTPTMSSVLRSEPIAIPDSTATPTYSTSAAKYSEPVPSTSSATSSGSGSPVRYSRVIAGSSFVPSFEEDTEMTQPAPVSSVSAGVKPMPPPSMEPVVIEMSQSASNSKALPIFSADTPERRSNLNQPWKSQYVPSSVYEKKGNLDEGPIIRSMVSNSLENAPNKVHEKLRREEEEDEDEDEDEEEEEEEEEEDEEEEEEEEEEDEKFSSENIEKLKSLSQPASNLSPHIGQLRNFSYSLESTEDVYPPDTSSASAVTSPHLSSDSASALEVPTSTSTTSSTHQSKYSTALSPPSNIVTTRLMSPSSMKGTPWAHAQFIQGTPKKPKSLKEIKKKYKPYKSVLQDPTSTTTSTASPRPSAAPFVLPDQMLTPSRLKILYSRNKFLSEQNLQSEASAADEFKAHKDALVSPANPQNKERRYASNMKPKSLYNSQEQLQKLKDMINSRPTRGRSESSLHECLHDNCILSEHGRREIIDKTLSIDNMHADIFQNLRRLGSEGDAGAYEDTFFPETSSDLYDLTFPSHSQNPYSLDRPASMSELHYSTISGSGPDLEPRSTTPSRHSTGKGRFAGHRQYKKSKSLCTLETNLDDDDDAFATSSMVEEDGMKRVPSVHELRISKSLQKLNVPDWYSKSSLSKSGSCLLKYGSSSTMSSFQFSPSLISSPCTTPSSSTNVVIKTRVLPPTSARSLRSPRFPSTSKSAPTTPSFMDHHDKGNKPASVRLPSDKYRAQEKAKALMPIPIVPFDKIRAMFEKKTPGNAAKSPKSSVSSPPTSPTVASNIQPSFKSPQHSEPPKTLSFNGHKDNYDDDDDDSAENMPVPRIIVSPTEPHVKGILKKPTSVTTTQEKRHSDIQEEPEPVEEPVIVRPIATRPVESSASLMQIEPPPIPTSAVPERPTKPQLGTVLKEENMLPKEDYTYVNTAAALRLMDDSFSSEDGKKNTSFSPQKEEPKQPVAKPRAFKFFKSLRSSSSSSSESVKEPKGRKSPSSSGQKHSPKHQSPNSSYDSSGFPASPTRKMEVPEVLSKSGNLPTKGPKPEESSNSGVRLEEAPVISPPPPSTSKTPTKESNLDNTPQETIQQPTNVKPINSAPTTTPTSPSAEEPKPEKKRWFPKPKDFRKTKAAKDNVETKPVTKDIVPEVRAEKPNAFEVNEMSYEPRRLLSTRSSDPNDSIVSERSIKSNTRPSELSLGGRKPSIDSNVSFGRDLDRVSDRALAGDIDRSGRAQNLDRRPNDNTARRDKGSRPFDLDHRSPSGTGDKRDPRKDFDRGEPVRGSERRERPRDFDRREPARHSDRPPRITDGRREPPVNVDIRPHSRDNEHRRSTDLDRNSITSSGDPRYGSRDYINRDSTSSRPSARSTDSMTPEDKPRSSGRWQPKPKGTRSSASPARLDSTNSNGAPNAYRYPVEGSAFNSQKPNTAAGLNTPPTSSKMNHDVTPSSPGDKSDKSVRETTV